MFNGLADSRLYAYLPEEPPASLQSLQSRYKMLETTISPCSDEKWLNFILVRKDTQQVIGYTQATLRTTIASHIAYLIFRDQWRNGFATEAVAATIDYVLEHHDTPSIEALVDTRNLASQKLLLKLGFECTEKIPNADCFKGCISDEYRYRITRKR